MKKLFSFITVMLAALTVNAAVINIDNTTANSLQTALNTAASGDEIVMAAGTYSESGNYLAFTGKDLTVRAADGANVIIQTVCHVRLKEGAKAEFINIKFDCSTIGEYEYVIVAADDTDNKRVVLTGCEFYGWAKNKAMIEATSSRRLASVTLDKCYVHDCMKSVIFIENTGSINLSVTNSTFANISTNTESFWAGVIDSRATAGSVLVDHCTFYNVQPMNTDYAAVGKVATPGAIVSNSIFVLPTATDGVRAIRDVAEAKNCITFNYLKDSGTGIHSSVTTTNCTQVDPLFVDAANGDYHLGEGSPALTAGDDGGAIGDPRWAVAPEPAKPEAAPAVPAHEEEDVMAIYCNHYTTNNLNYNIQNWAGLTWEVLDLGGTTVSYCPAITFEGLASNPIEARDFSGYKHLHFDVWVAEACRMNLTMETATGAKHVCGFGLNAGWNTIDADPAWWDKEGAVYDFKDVKFFIFEGFRTADDTEAFEGHPFAFANIYFWNDPAPKNLPATAPAAPTLAEEKVQALFSATYQERTFNFEPLSWGTQWVNYTYPTGEQIFHAESFAWDGFTNWGADHYNLTAYDMMHADVYVTVDASLKFTIEALSTGDGGSGWKNGAPVTLEANKWNSVEIDLLNAPYDGYDFTDMRYLILEGFTNEGTPLSIANVYFYNSMDMAIDQVDADKEATKRIIDGQLIIIKNGIKYNAQGTVIK